MISSIKIYKPFTVVTVPFPFTDRNSLKRRPALVISNEIYQKQNHHCVLTMITSAKQSRWHDDITIEDLKQAGLPGPSMVRFKIFSLDERLILRKLGELSNKDQQEVSQTIRSMFSLAVR
jgi:mRNA interferase MazF